VKNSFPKSKTLQRAMSNFKPLILIVLIMGCVQPSANSDKTTSADTTKTENTQTDSSIVSQTTTIPDSAFVNIKSLSSEFAFDMRYATSNNFLKAVVYDCDNCLMRHEVAKALLSANDSLIKMGYRVVFFDCFRPKEVQKQMWEIFPDSRYVANPYKNGSVHNKGAALDISLQKIDGSPVDMGTSFDHFGEEAHHAYRNLPDSVLQNRKILKTVMEAFGFHSIKTEWWHYNYGAQSKYTISDQALCP